MKNKLQRYIAFNKIKIIKRASILIFIVLFGVTFYSVFFKNVIINRSQQIVQEQTKYNKIVKTQFMNDQYRKSLEKSIVMDSKGEFIIDEATFNYKFKEINSYVKQLDNYRNEIINITYNQSVLTADVSFAAEMWDENINKNINLDLKINYNWKAKWIY